MKTLRIVLASVCGISFFSLPAGGTVFWPEWRGPQKTGVAAPDADPPIQWSNTQNIKWKATIPGFGTSTPIVWEDKVFIVTAVDVEPKAESTASQASPEASQGRGRGRAAAPSVPYRWLVLCFDRDSGKQVWEKVATEEKPHEGHHSDHGYASASPVTDGKLLIAYFGSRGLHCYDLDGNKKWTKDFGDMRTRNSFGEGSSPTLYKDKLILYWDDESDNDFVTALDKTTGKELWRTPRNEPTGWSTPFVAEHGGKAQVVINATGKVRSYDVETGKELWSCSGQVSNPIPTPTANKDTVFVTSGHRGQALFAIALGHTGDLDGTQAIRWSMSKNTPYVPSPLLVNDLLYTVSGNNPVLSCYDARTGSPHFEGERFEGLSGIYASPIFVKDRVYILGRNGTCVVLKQGPKPEVLARNEIGEKADASLAAVGKQLFLRTHRTLFCIE